MTVIFLTRLFYPHTGGVEKHVLGLSKELIKKKIKIVIITEKYHQALKEHENYKGLTIFRIPVPRSERIKKFAIWKWIIKNRSLFQNADIIHVHDIFFWMLPIVFINPSIQIFTTFHGYEGNKIPGVKARIMHKIAEKFSKRSLSVGLFYEKWYGTKSDSVTYGAIKISKTSNHANMNKELKVAFVGRLEEETGVMEYTTALAKVKDEIAYKAFFYGDGSKRKEIEKWIRKEKLPIVLKGWVTDTQEHIRNKDIILVSRYLGILESLVEQKVVIAQYTNEIKKDYLYMTPFAKYITIASSSNEIAKIIKDFVVSRKKYYQKAQRGYAWVKEYTWENLAEQYLNLWQR
jgi:glycosyltransferase involved in cell wall biosynthesis